MKNVARLTVLALVCGIGGPMTGCAARGSSFETLGVPTPEPRTGRSPVILGWAREQREGWAIKRVQVDDTTRPEWNEDTQAPAVLYLEPGEHTIKLSAAQLSDPRDPNSRTRRRYKVRPFEVDLLEGEAQMCVLRLSDDERSRPTASCEAYGYGEAEDEGAADDADEYGDEYADEDELGGNVPDEPASASAEPTPGSPSQPQPAPTTPAQPTAEVPSPFGEAPATAPATTPATAPTAGQPATVGPPRAAAADAPRRLTVEERLDRLERQMQDVVRLLRQQR